MEHEHHLEIVKWVRYIGGAILIIGLAVFIYGYFISDYTFVTGVGIGAIMSAVFIFMMGMFLVATDEMLNKSQRRKKVKP